MAEEIIVPIVLFATLFIGAPWILLHYITKWRQTSSLSREDENLLDDLYETARRLEDRVNTIERIVALDSPHWAATHLPHTAEHDPATPVKKGPRHA